MGLLNALHTSVSGMNAQSSYLSTIGDNIANSGTTGYKEATTAFETVLGQQIPGSYESGGVLAQTSYGITGQGTLTSSTSSTDLAIQGNGFFAVTNGGTGALSLTRAGSFTPDPTGNLVNTAGYTLMGYPISTTTGLPSATLAPVNISSSTLVSTPTTTGSISGNLPSTLNSTASGTTGQTSEPGSMTIYDNIGTAIPVTLSYTNNSSAGTNSWTVAATDASGNALASVSVVFDPSTGKYSSGGPLTFTIPSSPSSSSTNSISIDLSGMTQLASGFSAQTTANGTAPSKLSSVTIGEDGTLTGVYGSGAKVPLYDIPVATVTSPNNLTSVNGNIYQQSETSGALALGTAGQGASGKIESNNLESSTVDLATELTNMIVAQRAYEANSKVLQAASSLLQNLNQIQTG